ncbi:hypothetical protein BDF22DRAFT_745296 [Syncephalis plumigaleata]|nr:hypothetical protein BDF22DRAFT_745296 [Syncephalis plumigaleata]
MSQTADVLIIGAGVIGLTTALFLLEKGYRVNVVAEHYRTNNIQTTPRHGLAHTGGQWPIQRIRYSVKLCGLILHVCPELDTYTFARMSQLEKEVGNDAGIMFVDNQDYYTDYSLRGSNPWFQSIVPNVSSFRVMEKHELPSPYTIGYAYKTITINVPVYLVWLKRQVERLGGTIYRARLAYWNDILRVVPPADYNLTRVVVNCSGNGARTLGGVRDLDCHPTRGQTVLVRRPGFRKALTLAGAGLFCYVIPRNDGIVVLGGTYQPDPNVDEATAEMIVKHAVSWYPDLVDPNTGKLEIVRHAVGMRTTRLGGVQVNGHSTLLIHNYGHGGQGYQSSWGSAKKVHELLESSLDSAFTAARSLAKF